MVTKRVLFVVFSLVAVTTKLLELLVRNSEWILIYYV